ncbi:hypothetical protein [Brevundimonas sp. NIBR11]|uniref:hypothetical protein n=1 Tax=Brevundimonas sp. NIBR11 TaxID=3015999 RepID=UPI0022F055DC|nr:hypothetical protein [Brevundimonas sp. NIBR11]WGM30053.1 hypothetical protein KKHFBJBL_00268 [Brevundimonas sp. NIBR11]
MEHHRLRKYRGPETWAQVRQAYIAGESAPSLVRRFDVGYANLRRRAMAEGWTRKAHAARIDLKPIRGGVEGPGPDLEDLMDAPAMDPFQALSEAVRRAAGLLSQGRTAEATALLRAATALEKLKFVAR